MRVVKWIESESINFTCQEFDNIEVCLPLFECGEDDPFSATIVIWGSDAIKIEFKVLREFLCEDIDFKEVVRVVMLGDEGDPIAIGCPCETSAESAEIGSDLLIFFSEEPLGNSLNAFTGFCGHKDDLKKSIVASDVSDNIAAW